MDQSALHTTKRLSSSFCASPHIDHPVQIDIWPACITPTESPSFCHIRVTLGQQFPVSRIRHTTNGTFHQPGQPNHHELLISHRNSGHGNFLLTHFVAEESSCPTNGSSPQVLCLTTESRTRLALQYHTRARILSETEICEPIEFLDID